MKVTKSYLKKIISESIADIMKEDEAGPSVGPLEVTYASKATNDGEVYIVMGRLGPDDFKGYVDLESNKFSFVQKPFKPQPQFQKQLEDLGPQIAEKTKAFKNQ